MANVAPQGRKHLSADALFRLVHTGFDHIPDYRPADMDIALPDVLMSAFAMFSLKAPSLLAFDKERAEGNVHTISGIQRVPCDTFMREILDLVSPKWLRPVFTSVFRQLQRGKALEALTFLDGHYLWPWMARSIFRPRRCTCLPIYTVCTATVHHLCAPDVGRCDHPSGPAGRHAAHA